MRRFLNRDTGHIYTEAEVEAMRDTLMATFRIDLTDMTPRGVITNFLAKGLDKTTERL